jgi:hypothetical protein
VLQRSVKAANNGHARSATWFLVEFASARAMKASEFKQKSSRGVDRGFVWYAAVKGWR